MNETIKEDYNKCSLQCKDCWRLKKAMRPDPEPLIADEQQTS